MGTADDTRMAGPRIGCVRCGHPHTPRRPTKSGRSYQCQNEKECRKRQDKRRKEARR